MTYPAPRAPTVGAIADRHNVKVHQIRHIIGSRGLRPAGRAGNAYIYTEADAEFIGDELRGSPGARGSAMAAEILPLRRHDGVIRPNVPPGDLYPLTELPGRPWMPKKNGKRVNKFTCVRWALHGKRGFKLRTTMVGGLRCTCDAWAWDFFEKLNGTDPATAESSPRLAKDHEAAEAELAAEGIR